MSLFIGRLRPIDRAAVTGEVQRLLKTGSSESPTAEEPLIVVSTQCLEVGADLDFEALVTEAASLDSLRQRFGRLNRGGRDIVTRAAIILPGDQEISADKLDDAAPSDPIYRNALPRTWHWLTKVAEGGVVDFGINAMSLAVDALRGVEGEDALAAMLSPSSDAPILLPAYLDAWAQTNPAPAADPDVALFLHGPQREMADVQICWRGDLPAAGDADEWTSILSLCPPTVAECLPVPLYVFRAWLGSRGEFTDDSADVAENVRPVDSRTRNPTRGISAFRWSGPGDSGFTERGAALRPGDTVVLRAQDGGWDALGHVPDAPVDPQVDSRRSFGADEVRRLDVAESATATARRRAILRIHADLWPKPPEGTAAADLLMLARDAEQNWTRADIRDLLTRLRREDKPGWSLTSAQRRIIDHLIDEKDRLADPEPYPRNRGFVLTSRELLPPEIEGEDEDSSEAESDALLERARPQKLGDHTRDVLDRIESALDALPLAPWREALLAAATAHDWGKVDPRFQALLRGSTPFAAMASESMLAKSGIVGSSLAARRAARQRAGLPLVFVTKCSPSSSRRILSAPPLCPTRRTREISRCTSSPPTTGKPVPSPRLSPTTRLPRSVCIGKTG